jgi:gliding motility-associated-like protein
MNIFFRLALAASLLVTVLSKSSGQCTITVDAGDDIYLCSPPSPTQLSGSISGDYLSFMWTPVTGLTGASTLQPTVNVTQSTFYVLSASAADLNNNLVVNGDFEQGNTGFTSDYGYSPGNLVPEAIYDVLDNPQDDHPSFAPCDDHTSGAGSMMVVNGAGSPNQDVWCQTVSVIPNAQYVLSAWVTSVVAGSPALLQFSINGGVVGPIFNAPSAVCNWQNYFQVWNSGANSSATICIVNQNTALGGNDFALDDIVFAPVCVVRDTVRIQVVSVTAMAAPAVVTLPCEGATLTLNGTGSSTGTNIAYLWETAEGNIVSGATTLNPVVNAPGLYTLTVAYTAPDGTVCEKMASVNVVLSPNPLSAWITPPAPLGCGSTTTTLIGNSNQSGFSVFAWETLDGNIVSGANQKNCVVNQVGTYVLTVTNTNTGCTSSAEILVTATTTPPIAIAMVSDTLTCLQDTITLSSTGSSTGTNIAYAWTTTNGHFVVGQNSPTSLVNTVGTYILNVTNTTNNCTSRDTVTVVGNTALPFLAVPPTQQITCSADTIPLNIVLSPPPMVLIQWTASNGGHFASGQNTPSPTVDAAGTYVVVVQNPSNGCTSSGTVVVTANMNHPVATILPPGGITCQSSSVVLSGNGSSSGTQFGYAWIATNGGNIVSGENTLNPLVNSAGDYTLTVLDSLNGCASSANTLVVADTNVVIVVANAPDTLSCIIQTTLLNANGSSSGTGIDYAWSTSNGNIVSGADTQNPLVDQPGIYQLILTNTVNGCAGIDLAVVLDNVLPPLISIASPSPITCANPVQDLVVYNTSPSGSFVYLWTASNGGHIVSGENALVPTVDAPGTYTLSTTNLFNGCIATSSTTVALDTIVPTAVAGVPGLLTCAQQTQLVDGSASSTGSSFTYQWVASNGGNIVGNNNGITATVDAPGTYLLAVTNLSNGCVGHDTIVVGQDVVAPIADAGLPQTITCSTAQLSLMANAPNPPTTLLYQWFTSDGSIVSAANSAQIVVDAPGYYEVAVTNPSNGCSALDTVQMFNDTQLPALSLSTPATLTCTLAAQNLAVQNQSLPGAFSYLWFATGGGHIVSGGNSLSATIDEPGTYTLITTNLANGCTAILSTPVSQDIAPPVVVVANPVPITCVNPSQVVQAQNLATTGVFSYNWTASNGGNLVSGSNTLTPVVDHGGNYTLVSTNLSNGCSSSNTVSVAQNNTLPDANAGADATLTCNLVSMTLSGGGTGAVSLNYSWLASNGGQIASGGSTPAPVIDAPGTYTLTVINPDNGCTDTDVVEIFNDAGAPTVSVGTAPMLTCALTQTPLSATASAGATFSYLWTATNGGNILTGPTTLSPIVNEPGVYTLVVTNAANGCTRSGSVTVLENILPPIVDAGASATLTCAVTSLSLTGVSSGGAATYAWQTAGGNIVSGANSLTPTVNKTGTYTLTATLSSNGCTASDMAIVGIDTIAPTFSIQQPALLTCTQLTITLTGLVQQPGIGNFTASWNTTTGHFVSGQNSLNAVVDAPGTYILSIQNGQNGCNAAKAVPVFQNINPPTALTGPAGNITCAVQSLMLNGSGSSTGTGFSYLWTATAGGQLLNGGTTLSPTVGSAGTYILQVTNTGTGCTASSTTTVGSNTTPPTVAIAPPAVLTCIQNNVTLNGNGSSTGANFTPSWTTASGNIVSGQNTLMPVVNTPGTYLLTVLNGQNGCSTTAQTLVTQNIVAPGAEAGTAEDLHCNRPTIALNGTSSTSGNMVFSWSSNNGHFVGGSNAPSSTVDTPGQYTLTVSNPLNGCTSTDNVVVNAVPLPAFDPTLVQPNCNDRNGAVDFGSVTGGKSPFEYAYDGGQLFGNQTNIDNLPPDTYTLVVRDAFGCTAAETVTINPPFLPSLSIPTVATLLVGDSIRLDPVTDILPANIASWQWSPAEGLSCTDCARPWAKPFRSTNYTLIVRDVNGCDAEAQVPVRVDRKRNLYAPNVFSPNGDGENDFFTLFARGVKEIQALRVYDRWGSELFLGEHLQQGDEPSGWDGTFRGSPLTPAVFVWWAKVEFADGEVEIYYGDITLVR